MIKVGDKVRHLGLCYVVTKIDGDTAFASALPHPEARPARPEEVGNRERQQPHALGGVRRNRKAGNMSEPREIVDEPELYGPCRWCGYNGEKYWQAKTHDKTCPWHRIGGEINREMMLRLRDCALLEDVVASALSELRSYETSVRYRKRPYPERKADVDASAARR